MKTNVEVNEDNTPIKDEDDEEIFAEGGEVSEFDRAVGILEEIVMSNRFREVQDAFFMKYRPEFDDSEENKIHYTEIHTNFAELMEEHVTSELEVNNINLSDFLRQVHEQDPDTLCGDMWDLLFSLTDFSAFKELILSFPLPDENENEMSFGPSITSSSTKK